LRVEGNTVQIVVITYYVTSFVMGGPDSSAIGVPSRQKRVPCFNWRMASCGFAAPIDKLSGLPKLNFATIDWYNTYD
jgi:hypothetical protein